MPPMWSACGCVATSRSIRSTPSASSCSTGSPPPASISAVRPSGDRTRTASPWPMSRKVISTAPACSPAERAAAGGSASRGRSTPGIAPGVAPGSAAGAEHATQRIQSSRPHPAEARLGEPGRPPRSALIDRHLPEAPPRHQASSLLLPKEPNEPPEAPERVELAVSHVLERGEEEEPEEVRGARVAPERELLERERR